MIDCERAAELLDAYALGALEKAEAGELKRHVAACPRCSEELSKSERTAALLALSIPIKEAPPRVRERLLEQAGRDVVVGSRVPLLERLHPGRRLTARVAALGGAGVAALVFAALLQFQMSALRGDNGDLEEQLSAASTELEQQRQIVAVLSASDARKMPMEAATISSPAESVYNWSRQNRSGFIVCSNFPALPGSNVYQVWLTAEDGPAEPVATFVPQDGYCQIPMDMSRLDWRPAGIGISIEPEGGSERPSSRWFAYADFQRETTPQGRWRDAPSAEVAVTAIGP